MFLNHFSLRLSFTGIIAWAHSLYDKHRLEYTSYKLSGYRAICDITQLDMKDPIDFLRDEAYSVIYEQKLSLSTDYTCSYKDDKIKVPDKITTKVFAPYGTWNDKLGCNRDFLVTTISNKNPKIDKPVPDYLLALQQYLEAAMLLAHDEKRLAYIDHEYISPLDYARIEWQGDELKNGRFGHIYKYAHKLDENNLSVELRDQLGYFTTVVKICHYILKKQWIYHHETSSRNQLVYALDAVYAAGPYPFRSKLKDNKAIGVEEYFSRIFTPWGEIYLDGASVVHILYDVWKKNSYGSIKLVYSKSNIFTVTEAFGNTIPPNLEFINSSPNDQQVIKDWNTIRDYVFKRIYFDTLPERYPQARLISTN